MAISSLSRTVAVVAVVLVLVGGAGFGYLVWDFLRPDASTEEHEISYVLVVEPDADLTNVSLLIPLPVGGDHRNVTATVLAAAREAFPANATVSVVNESDSRYLSVEADVLPARYEHPTPQEPVTPGDQTTPTGTATPTATASPTATEATVTTTGGTETAIDGTVSGGTTTATGNTTATETTTETPTDVTARTDTATPRPVLGGYLIEVTIPVDRRIDTRAPVGNEPTFQPRFDPGATTCFDERSSATCTEFVTPVRLDYDAAPNTTVHLTTRVEGRNTWFAGGWTGNAYSQYLSTEFTGSQSGWADVSVYEEVERGTYRWPGGDALVAESTRTPSPA